MRLSLVFPVYNEEKNIPLLLERVYAVLHENRYEYEILAVNDGSKDQSYHVLEGFAKKDKHLRLINFRVNAGQTAALRAGIEHATGDVIVMMDSDLENNPADIPRLLAKINEGFDVVSGWRKNRWGGKFLSRKIPSTLANALISNITGVHLNDYGCTLKAYRRDVLQGVPLYGEMHRFIPAYASWQGAKVTEIEVEYAPRLHGKSNYGLMRTFSVLLDLVLIRFIDRYMDRPIHFFGGLGFVLFFLGSLAGLAAVILRFYGLHLVQTPLPVLAAFLVIAGMNLVMMGIIAEMLMRTYYEANGKKPYLIKDTVNL